MVLQTHPSVLDPSIDGGHARRREMRVDGTFGCEEACESRTGVGASTSEKSTRVDDPSLKDIQRALAFCAHANRTGLRDAAPMRRRGLGDVDQVGPLTTNCAAPSQLELLCRVRDSFRVLLPSLR